MISSVSRWSAFQERDRGEAAGANGRVLHWSSAFHTGEEQTAWWMVDLLERHRVGRVEIVHCGDHGGRFQHFAIESGDNEVDWIIGHTRTDDDPVSADADRPWIGDFDQPSVCRFPRIRRLGPPGFLHLRRVRVFEPSADVVGRPSAFGIAGLLAEASGR